jgi:methyl-accepting chemotaxis protein
MAHQIASAAEEQRATTVDINSNVEMISALSGENSIEIEKAKESSLALDKLATEQKQLVSKFKF